MQQERNAAAVRLFDLIQKRLKRGAKELSWGS